MALPAKALDWMGRAGIDYLGPFVKAWAAFNVWYRHDSNQVRERDMLNFAISDSSSRLRRYALPLLDNGNTTAPAQSLKQAICDLHLKLDAIHLEVTRKNVRERISLRTVCITTQNWQDRFWEKNRHRFGAAKIQGGSIEVSVTALSTGHVKFQYAQPQYEPALVYALPDFANNLSGSQQTTFRQFYDSCNPRPMHDLVKGLGPLLTLPSMDFRCTPSQLLAGLVETIYAMRNALLHGEVDPDEQVLACYEPAYRIVMGFLDCMQ